MFIFTDETRHLIGRDEASLIFIPEDDPEPGRAAAWWTPDRADTLCDIFFD